MIISGQSKKFTNSRILLLESGPSKDSAGFPQDWKDAPYSNRVCAIAQHSVKLLQKLGAWEYVEAVRSKPFTNMQVIHLS